MTEEEEILKKYSTPGLRRQQKEEQVKEEEKPLVDMFNKELEAIMTEFDAIKAIREEIVGLSEIRSALVKRETNLQRQYGEIEVEYNMVMRLRGFADAELNRKRGVLRLMESGDEIP